MKVLVTGATGGLGRNAVDALTADNAAVRATGRNLQTGSALRAEGIDFTPAELAELTEWQADELLRDVDVVWHCAALSSPWGRREDFVASNVTATRRLAQAAVKRNIRRFIHVSTPSIYFDYQHHRGIEESYRAKRFVNHYAATKARAEDEIRALAGNHPDTTFVLLRPRGLFGPNDRVIMPRILHLLRARSGILPMPRGGAAIIDLTYVGNVVHAMRVATHANVKSGDAFNITNFDPSTLASLLRRLLTEELDIHYQIRSIAYPVLDAVARFSELGAHLRNGEPMLTRYGVGALNFDMTLSNAHASEVLGYRPIFGLDEGIRLTSEWIRTHGDHYRI